MSSPRLPRIVDLRRLATHGSRLRGSVPLAELERLCTEVRDTSGEVDVDLEFGAGSGGHRFVSGTVQLALPLVCQRCLGPMVLPLLVAIAADMVGGQEALDALPSEREGWIVDPEGDDDLYALLEDEIFLALPFAPSHADGQCEVQLLHDDERNADSDGQEHPFAVLAGLKKPTAPAEGH